MKKIFAIILSCAIILGVTGCGKIVGDMDIAAGQSAIYIKEDGTICYAVAEKFDKDYYDKKELEKQIEAEIKKYNNYKDASVDDALSLDKFKVKKNVAIAVFEFATVYDFNVYGKDFNKFDTERFYVGSIAGNSDCKIEGDFLSPDKKKSATAKEIKKMSDADIIIVDSQYKIEIEGIVHYMSDNCSVDEKGIVTTSKKDGELSYVIYSIH